LRKWQTGSVRFVDLAPGHLAYRAAALATASGVLPRSADGTFDPARLVTGAEASATVERLRAMAPKTIFTAR
jgi:hypothetical protein